MDNIKIYKGRRSDISSKNLVEICRTGPSGVDDLVRDIHLVRNWYINMNRSRVFKYTLVDREELERTLGDVINYVAKDAKVEVPNNISPIVQVAGILKYCCELSDEDIIEVVEGAMDTSKGFTGCLVLNALQQVEMQLKFDNKIMMCNIPNELIRMMKSNDNLRKDLTNEILNNCGELKCYSLSPKIAELFEILFGY